MTTSEQKLLICTACGTQLDESIDKPLRNCFICDVLKPQALPQQQVDQAY